MKTGAQPLLDRWQTQSKMYKQFAEDSAEEFPPEMIKQQIYYQALADQLDSCGKELREALKSE